MCLCRTNFYDEYLFFFYMEVEPLQWLFEHGTQVLCSPETEGAWYRGYRLMALDGSLFNVPDTQANAAAFGRSCNQYGKAHELRNEVTEE